MRLKFLLLAATAAIGCATLAGCRANPYYGNDHENRFYVPAEMR